MNPPTNPRAGVACNTARELRCHGIRAAVRLVMESPLYWTLTYTERKLYIQWLIVTYLHKLEDL